VRKKGDIRLVHNHKVKCDLLMTRKGLAHARMVREVKGARKCLSLHCETFKGINKGTHYTKFFAGAGWGKEMKDVAILGRWGKGFKKGMALRKRN